MDSEKKKKNQKVLIMKRKILFVTKIIDKKLSTNLSLEKTFLE